MSTHAAKLEKSHGERLPETRDLLRQIQTDATFLQQKWISWAQQHSDRKDYSGNIQFDLYFRDLLGARNQLKRLANTNDEDVAATVKAVAIDLHVKAENCRHSLDGLGKEIKVTVRTKQGTEEITGFEVWCAPMALARFKDEHIRFPKVSSPTVFKNLAPGYYAMWLIRGKEKGPSVAQTIGGNGETELEIDLPVPPASDPAR
ncbi:MAG: hypothetical protein HY043_12430 [Verrucomicrobia bacterium]|nr:hypothetical protein [Verrucomicrobiota bacterium]